jgi:protein-tyrosine phosphatase
VEGEKGHHRKAQSRQHWRSMSWTRRRTSSFDDSNLSFDHEADNSENITNKATYIEKLPGDNSTTKEDATSGSNHTLITPQVALCPPLQSLSISPIQDKVSDANNLLDTSKEAPKLMRSGTLNIKLDLGSMPEQSYEGDDNGDNEVIQKRDKLTQCDKQCSRVSPHVYFGGNTVAQNYDVLNECKITHILNCVGFECPEYFAKHFHYKTLWLQDHPSEDITSLLYNVFDYFEDVREQNGHIFVHCIQGVSRSASLVIAYLIWCERRSYEEILEKVKAIRCVVSPNMGFSFQLLQWQTRVLPNISSNPINMGPIVRLYRIAPHSAFDPLHLVPKVVLNPNVSSLDSRGAFVLLLQQGIFIWRGKTCANILKAAADRASFQFIHYEHVSGPIVSIREGNEPREICDILHMNDPHDHTKTIHEFYNSEYTHDFDLLHRVQAGVWIAPILKNDQLPSRDGNWHIKINNNSKHKVES